jgi:hypothetical protein
MCKIIFHSHYSPCFFFLSHQTEFAAASLILHAEIQHNHVNGLKNLSAELASRGDSFALGWHCRATLPRRAVLAFVLSAWMLWAPPIQQHSFIARRLAAIFAVNAHCHTSLLFVGLR